MRPPLVVLAGLAVCAGAVLALALVGWPANVYRNSDFVQFYSGARAIAEGASPYDTSWWTALHERLGSGAVLRAPPHPVAGPLDWTTPYPLWTFLVLLPFGLLPFAVAAPAWVVAEAAALVVSLLSFVRGLRYKARDAIVFAGFTLAFQPLWLTPSTGNVSAFVAAAFVGAFAAALAGRGALAGALASLVLLKPQSYLIAMPVLLLALPRGPRSTALLFAALAAAALGAGSWLVQPGWVAPWLANARALQATEFSNATGWTVHRLIPGAAPLVSAIVVALAGAALTAWWWRARPSYRVLVAAALPISVFVSPHGWTYDSLALLASLGIAIGCVDLRGHRVPRLAVIAAVFCVLPWLLYLSDMSGNGEELSALVPLAVFLATIWIATPGTAVPAVSGSRASDRSSTASPRLPSRDAPSR